MNDLISRRDAIALYYGDETNDLQYKVPVPVIIQNLKDLPAADNWIPCSEKLPEESGVYIVTRHSYIDGKMDYADIIRYGYPDDGEEYNHRVWYFIDSEYGDIAVAFDKVIAWQPLPEPYKKVR